MAFLFPQSVAWAAERGVLPHTLKGVRFLCKKQVFYLLFYFNGIGVSH